MSLGDFNNDRQPEIANETGNIYISWTMTDSVEISTANPRFSTMDSSIVSLGDCDNDATSEMAKLAPKTVTLCHFRLSDVVTILCGRCFWARRGQQSQICHSNIMLSVIVRDISISGFAVKFLLPVVRQCRIYLWKFWVCRRGKTFLLPPEL